MSPMSTSNYGNENAVNCAGKVRIRTTMGHAVNCRIKWKGGKRRNMPELWWNLKDAQSVTAGTPLLNFPFSLSFFFSFSGRASDVW